MSIGNGVCLLKCWCIRGYRHALVCGVCGKGCVVVPQAGVGNIPKENALVMLYILCEAFFKQIITMDELLKCAKLFEISLYVHGIFK